MASDLLGTESVEDIGPDLAETLRKQIRAEKLERIRNIPQEDILDRLTPVEPKEQTPAKQPVTLPSGAPAKVGEAGADFDLPGLDVATSVAKDVGKGITEAIPAVFHGLVEVVADSMMTLVDLADFVDKQAKGLGIPDLPGVGKFPSSSVSRKTRATLREVLPNLQVNTESTVTGNMIRDVTNFATVFVPISGQLRAGKFIIGLGKKLGEKFGPTSARVTANAIAGALTEFTVIDTVEADLDILMDDHPVLRDPIEAFLAGESGDTVLEKRTKAAFIGAGLGVAGDLLFVSLGALRSAVRAKVLLKRAHDKVRSGQIGTDITKIEGPKITGDQASISGFGKDESLVRVSTTKASDRISKAEDELRREFPDLTPEDLRARAEALPTTVEINFDNINSAEAVEQLMQDATDLFGKSVDTARRGVRPNELTKEAADQLDVGITEVLTLRTGTALNAEQTQAYRQVWVSAAEKVEELARIAANSKNEVDIFRFRKGMAVFNAINQTVLGARAEAGRTLQAWRISVSGDTERAAVIATLVDSSGGSRVGQKMAKAILDAIEAGHSPGQINKLLERGFFAKTSDAVKESAIIGLLWRPATHIVNIGVNAIRIGMGIVEKGVAARIGRETMTEDGVVIGEAMAQMRGTIGAIRGMLDKSVDSEILARATAQSVAQTGRKIDIRLNTLSAEGFGLDPSSGLGKFVETFGNITRAPADFLRKSDDLFKMVAYAGEVEAQAFRQAVREGVKNGLNEVQVAQRMAHLISDPAENIRLAAGNAALYSTFTQQAGSVASLLFKARDTVPGLAYVVPFVRTPINILRYNFEFSPMAPLVGQWRADIARGGASRDIAFARLAIGTSFTALFADWADEGVVQGPLPRNQGVREAMMRQNVTPDSLRIGNFTVRVGRVEPFGMNVSAVGGISQVLREFQLEEEDFPEVSKIFAAIAISMGDSVLDKTFFTGISRLSSVMQNPDRRGPRFLQQTLQMLVPFSSAVRSVNQIVTPARADVSSFSDSIQDMTFGLSSRLPRARTLHGHLIIRPRIDIINPIQIRRVKESPIDQEIIANDADIRRVPRTTSFDGVSVNFREFPFVYEKYVTLAGHEFKMRGKGEEKTLNDLVQSRRYQRWSRGPDGRRVHEMRRVIRLFRQAVQREIIRDPRNQYQTDEFKRFREYVSGLKSKKRSLSRPNSANITIGP